LGTSGASGATLPADWTKVKGTIQEINLMERQVKIQDEKGNLSQVMIDTDVTINKGGKSVSMSQLKQGDKVTLTRQKPAGEYGNKG
jgi:3-dehydroquinate synthase class II